MVPQPSVIETRIHATVPKDMQLTDRDSAFTRDIFHGQRVGSFLEGPSFDRHGNLLMVDIAHGRIMKLSPSRRLVGRGQVRRTAERPQDPQGRAHLRHRPRRTASWSSIPSTARSRLSSDRDKLPGFKGTNDLFFASNGDLYFTDQGETGLHDPTGPCLPLLGATGKLDCLIDNVPSPNGLVIDPQETHALPGGDACQCGWRLPLRPDGSVHRVGLFCQLIGGWGPDGLAVDTGAATC